MTEKRTKFCKNCAHVSLKTAECRVNPPQRDYKSFNGTAIWPRVVGNNLVRSMERS